MTKPHPPPVHPTRLTWKKRKFLEHYIKTGVGWKAYQHAYDVSPTIKHATMQQAASRLLREAICQEYLDKHFAHTAELAGITRQRVVRRAAALAFADIRDLYDDNGNLKPLSTLTKKQAAMIAGLEVERDVTTREEDALGVTETIKVKVVNPVAAIAQLSKMLGLEVTKVQDVSRGGVFNIVLDD